MAYDREAHMRQLAYARSCRTDKTGERISAANKARWANSGTRYDNVRVALRASQAKATAVRIERALATRETRFWEKVEKTDSCWNWKGSKNNKGYGQVRMDGKCRLAHHYSLELAGRPRPDGLVARHQCDNPACVRPDHIEWGTQRENMQEAKARGRINTTGLDLGRNRAPIKGAVQ